MMYKFFNIFSTRLRPPHPRRKRKTVGLSLHRIRKIHYFCSMKTTTATFFRLPVLLALALALAACDWGRDGDEDQLKADVDSFAVHYFNWRYADALPYCTDESRPWLQFAASNVRQQDVDSLRAMESGTSCEVSDIDYTSDSTALATVRVDNLLVADTLDRPAHRVYGATVRIPLVFRGKWRVHLSALPRCR